jgi:hypothetical protein
MSSGLYNLFAAAVVILSIAPSTVSPLRDTLCLAFAQTLHLATKLVYFVLP